MPTRVKIPVVEIARERDAAPHGEKGWVIRKYASRCNVSEATIHRLLSQAGYRSGKKSPRSAGIYTAERMQMVWRKKALSIGHFGREINTEAALEILASEGHEWAASMNSSSVNRALNRYGFRRPKAHRKIGAAHAGHIFQIDFTTSKCFKPLRPTEDRDDLILRVTASPMAYKEDNRKYRLWLGGMIDAKSRLAVFRYLPSTGESVFMGFDFLEWFINRPDDGHLMRHAPTILQGDQGAFLKSDYTVNALRHVGIKRHLNGPGEKESNGKIERAWKSLWSQFEVPLATRLVAEFGDKCEYTLSELNQDINEYALALHRYAHPDDGSLTRGRVYQESVLKHRVPLIAGIDIKARAFKATERQVCPSSATVSLDGVRLQAPEALIGRRVLVMHNLDGEYMCEPIGEGSETMYRLTPVLENIPGQPMETTIDRPLHERIQARVMEESRELGKQTRKTRALLPDARVEELPGPFSPSDQWQDPELVPLSLLDASVLFDEQFQASHSYHGDTVVPELVKRGLIYEGMTRLDVLELVADLGARFRRSGS